MPITVEIRKHQFYKDNDPTKPVIINCLDNNKAEWVTGTVDSTWYDVTADVGGLDDFRLTYTSVDGSAKSSEKGASFNIDLVGGAAAMINDWLFSTPCNYINYFDARIKDTECGIEYKYYELKPDNIEFCGDEGCGYTFPLRETNDKYDVLKRISIHDNWQKWFSEDGNKDHPTFQTVVLDITGGVGSAINIGTLLIGESFPITKILTAIGSLFPAIRDWVNTALSFRDQMKEVLGFGRFAPAPKIYTILENAAIKLGISLDTPFNPGKELHNDCLYVPYGGNYHMNKIPGNGPSPSMKHIWGNRYIWQMTEFLDELSKLYNLTWDLYNNTLVIKFKKDVYAQDAQLEILKTEDCNTPFSICYEYGLTKKAGFGRYEYTTDPGDFASNQVQLPYNDIVDYDGVAENPMLEGSIDKRLQFASTAFYNDGFGSDGHSVRKTITSAQIYASVFLLIIVANVAALTGGVLSAGAAAILAGIFSLWLGFLFEESDLLRRLYANKESLYGIVRLKGSGVVNSPRVLRWDTNTPMNDARVVKTNTDLIQINPYFNTDNIKYRQQFDKYTSSIYQPITTLYNYPLYFDSWYYGNLYDMYHNEVDNPMVVNEGHKVVTVIMPLTCDLILDAGLQFNGITLVGNVAYIAPDIYIRVTEITVDYSNRSITIKGKILNK